ncbi:nucleoside monophosphate kinase [Citricoccus sp. NPDC079358]|uniref:adenylate kinase family protein n=1 Tax=Micrococcaceae TaxID=1268 RepID=UPI000691AA73|nr:MULTISPECIES: nucleoside monophosphate kinase [Micrococcaceae]MDP9989139.1 adenylate kinase family enzyme [Arthrobacter oryzae]
MNADHLSSWVGQGRAGTENRRTPAQCPFLPAISSAPTSASTPRWTWRRRNYVETGDFVPDSITNLLVRARLQEKDVQNGFLLDSYPRARAQASELDEILAANNQEMTLALHLAVDDNEHIDCVLSRAKIEGRSVLGSHPSKV